MNHATRVTGSATWSLTKVVRWLALPVLIGASMGLFVELAETCRFPSYKGFRWPVVLYFVTAPPLILRLHTCSARQRIIALLASSVAAAVVVRPTWLFSEWLRDSDVRSSSPMWDWLYLPLLLGAVLFVGSVCMQPGLRALGLMKKRPEDSDAFGVEEGSHHSLPTGSGDGSDLP